MSYRKEQQTKLVRRQAIPIETQRALWERSGNRCEWCGNAGKLEAHHIEPVRLGGANDLGNLEYLCRDCHHSADQLAAAEERAKAARYAVLRLRMVRDIVRLRPTPEQCEALVDEGLRGIAYQLMREAELARP